MNAVFISLALTAVSLAIFYVIFRNRLSINEKQKKNLEHIENGIQTLVIEMNNTTDRNIVLIEERINELKNLIEQADKRITVLKKEQKQGLGQIKKDEPAAPIISFSVPKKLTFRDQVMDLHDKGLEAKIIATRLKANIGEVELIISLAKGKQDGDRYD
ncbi:MAG: hypothetical protein JW874_15070 [Spirochaetales bacterium]|nr:hypothetical protein [Spirochaetales bacterium]